MVKERVAIVQKGGERGRKNKFYVADAGKGSARNVFKRSHGAAADHISSSANREHRR